MVLWWHRLSGGVINDGGFGWADGEKPRGNSARKVVPGVLLRVEDLVGDKLGAECLGEGV